MDQVTTNSLSSRVKQILDVFNIGNKKKKKKKSINKKFSHYFLRPKSDFYQAD